MSAATHPIVICEDCGCVATRGTTTVAPDGRTVCYPCRREIATRDALADEIYRHQTLRTLPTHADLERWARTLEDLT